MTVVRESWTVADLAGELQRRAEGFDDLFYLFADCPFLDATIAERMHANHRRYWADYTFADGYPQGLAPEILRRETTARLKDLAGDGRTAPDRETIFSLVKKDINSFDIETELAPVDMRLLRASLSADTERNFLLVSRMAERGAWDAETACRVLQEDPEVLRTLPAFFPVQVVERCPHACAYCPHPVARGNVREADGCMPLASFRSLVRKIEEFSREAVVDISLWGEPAYHPQVFELICAVLEKPALDLVIETSGVGWDPAIFQRIAKDCSRQPTWIVSLDATSAEMYGRLRGEGFAEAMRSADTLLSLFPASTWVQAVRMRENEDDLEVFYRSWKSRTENIIIQKYDAFCGMLPDRKVADLSPLKRFPCWHVKRDMPILLDGTVPQCREDLGAKAPLGNAFHEDLDAIWGRGLDLHRSHLAGQWPGICATCDEYYTYNY
jgi:spiro-SPASM protein